MNKRFFEVLVYSFVVLLLKKQTHALHRANKRTVSFFFTKCLRPREVSNKHM